MTHNTSAALLCQVSGCCEVNINVALAKRVNIENCTSESTVNKVEGRIRWEDCSGVGELGLVMY